MADDGLSTNVEAELAKAGFGEPGTASTPVSAPAVDAGSTKPDQSFFNNRSTAPEDDESSDDENEEIPRQDEADSSEETDETGSSGKFVFKGDGKELELDPVKDRAEIEKRLSMSEGAKRAFSQRAKLQKEVKEKEAKLAQYEPKAQLLEKMQKAYEDGGEEAAYEIFSGGKSFNDIIEQRVKEELAFREASPSEQRELERDRRERERDDELARERRKIDREREEVQKERSESEINRAHSMAFPAFKEVVKDLRIKDPIERRGVSKMLWKQTWDNIADLGDGVDLTPELFEQEFTSAAKLLGHSRREQAKEEVKKIVDKKKTVAKKKASAAASKNYKRGFDPKSLEGLSPTKIFDKMFG